jgi:hypothetical protein
LDLQQFARRLRPALPKMILCVGGIEAESDGLYLGLEGTRLAEACRAVRDVLGRAGTARGGPIATRPSIYLGAEDAAACAEDLRRKLQSPQESRFGCYGVSVFEVRNKEGERWWEELWWTELISLLVN